MPLEYTDPHVREAILAASILAIVHFARTIAPTIRSGSLHGVAVTCHEPWHLDLTARSNSLRDQIHEWVARSDGVDADLAQILDALVPRTPPNRARV